MVSIDGSPLALPATSEDTTKQREDTTEQHEHHFLDPSCHICMGGGWGAQDRCRGGGQAGAERGLSRNRTLWPGEKAEAGRGAYLCPRSHRKEPGSKALGWLPVAAASGFSFRPAFCRLEALV